MLAAVFHGIDDLRIEDVERPVCQEDEICLKVLACAVCGTDLRVIKHGHPKVTPPAIIGHEFVGVISEMGEVAARCHPGFEVGDRIVVAPGIPCMECEPCRRGERRLCQAMVGAGYQMPGGFAEYLKLPGRAAYGFLNVPADTPDLHAVLMEPLACCVHGQAACPVSVGDSVAVFGAGAIGCMHAELARLSGATRMIMLDVSARKLELARRVNPRLEFVNLSEASPASAVVSERTGGAGVDVSIVACSSAQAQRDALAVTRRGGRVLFFAGLPQGASGVELDTNLVHYRELTVFGAFGSGMKDQVTSLNLISSGLLNAAGLVSEVVTLPKLPEALARMGSGDALKVVVVPQGR